ncbi:MAG: adenosylcobinamide-GDP ribazoletransferase [Nocardioides sp.]
MRDAWRLATGTLTAMPVAAPRAVTPAVARSAMLLAPLAAVPLGLLVAGLGLASREVGASPWPWGFVAVGALAAGSRALHLDGLSDTVDGLTASYDAERSLAVMRSGSAGPAGVVAVVVTLGAQALALGTLFASLRGIVLAGLLVCLSRCALAITCARGVAGARTDGLGSSYTGTVPRAAAVAVWLVAASLAGLVAPVPLRGVLAVVLAAIVVVVLVRRTVRRLGGVTGDVFGAAIELALATLLVVAA